jgi:hypothetical protein
MSEYGYIPQAPTQSWVDNKGIFTPNDIYDLTRDDKFKNLGQLELIETKTVSSAVCDFTDLKTETYNNHLVTFTDIHFASQSEFGYKVSNDNGASFATGYQFANQRGIANGSFAERKSTGQDSARLCGDIDDATNSLANGYMYLYNAGDSTKYTFSTSSMVFVDNTDTTAMEFGGQLYPTVAQIHQIRFGLGTTCSAMASATISLYGIKAY